MRIVGVQRLSESRSRLPGSFRPGTPGGEWPPFPLLQALPRCIIMAKVTGGGARARIAGHGVRAHSARWPGSRPDSNDVAFRTFLHQSVGVFPGRNNRNCCALFGGRRQHLSCREYSLASIAGFRGDKDLRRRFSASEVRARTTGARPAYVFLASAGAHLHSPSSLKRPWDSRRVSAVSAGHPRQFKQHHRRWPVLLRWRGGPPARHR